MSKKEYKIYKISYNIGENDLNHKKKNINKQLLKENQVKVMMSLRGRGASLYRDPLEHLIRLFSEYKLINAWGKENNYYLFIDSLKKIKYEKFW